MSIGVCRFCDRPLQHTFANLGMSPLANSYIKSAQMNQVERFFPLHALVCDGCFLVQLQEFESPEAIFGDYAYFSSFSDSFLQHAKTYVEMAVDRFKLNGKSQVVEVASNDGYLLQYFVQKGVPVLGIEPAANVAEVARKRGITSLVKFFGTQTALEMKQEGRQADLLVGNNVLAHVPNLNDFVAGIKIVLKAEGVVTMEFPHLVRLIEDGLFDTIYHEHFSYFSFFTVEQVFAKHGLVLFDVEEVSTHGGSLRIYGRHAEHHARPISPRVAELKQREKDLKLDRLEPYLTFSGRVEQVKRNLLRFLIDAKDAKKVIAAYGAPAKGNTLLNYCGIRTDFIDYTIDRSPHKQGQYLPGSHIPILSPDAAKETKPDYLLILAWNLKDEIMEQMRFIREWGGRFVVPLPDVTIY
ncbi:MAG: class I SAM-dependent methyltransferase [Nitrospira sp.]|nr:class I SAM-dependent methyltransferase [Nitrospira sp.]